MSETDQAPRPPDTESAGVARLSQAARPSDPSLEEREQDILSELAREVDAWVTFQGLRRQLGVHQQALARTLRRLEVSGWVAHADHGYQLTEAGFSVLRARSPGAPQRPVIPIVQAILPPHISVEHVAAQLSRRWFGGLRWYGRSDGPGETALHWIADRAKVTVRVGPGSLTLEVEDTHGAEGKSFMAARPVLAAIAELYGTGNALVESSSRSAA